jgi:hypothetical protein
MLWTNKLYTSAKLFLRIGRNSGAQYNIFSLFSSLPSGSNVILFCDSK